jgi:hypothetical protein
MVRYVLHNINMGHCTYLYDLKQTSAVPPDPDQIIRQAEIISCLIEQRDMLVQQAEEQRLRWNSEKDGWARMAEALITQQAKHKNAADRDEVSHLVIFLSL